ncbi:DUF86 domain-containing protein [Bacillus sp. FJAT-50079]|uniref:DUF86 domain-containing protein n=1 Tax=Bacillus sp. FJAT-50079 TaxID=2833577 RepID=UPI001BCA4F07|nr:DUF86 domain-containing protein [Bacillus sp. FJAT-50079]MBS4208530.1 DUF86 domain-containing protein [Bacillus sp. FJAT-50079]
MYFVDRQKMEETLTFMENQLSIIKKHRTWESELEQLALERLAHTVIEAILDTGNAMIDGFIMRDPGSYEDIVDILLDEKVITDQLSVALKELILYRKMLVQQYVQVDHLALQQLLSEKMPVIEQFPDRVRTYLTNELGPISAFVK